MVDVYEVSGWDMGKADEHRDEKMDYVVMEKDYTKLEAELGAAKAFHKVAVTERDYERQKNQKLRDALVSISKNTCCDTCQEAALVAKQALEDE